MSKDQIVEYLRVELQRSQEALAASRKELDDINAQLRDSLMSDGQMRSTDSSTLSNQPTEIPVPLSQVLSLHNGGVTLRRAPSPPPPSMIPLFSAFPGAKRAASETVLAQDPGSLPPHATRVTSSTFGRVAPPFASRVMSGVILSRQRSAISDVSLVKQVSSFFQKIVNPQDVEREEKQIVAATVIQAAARGASERHRYRWRRQITASVDQIRIMEGRARVWGQLMVPAYVITVVRGGVSWTVEHRYSDWRELNRRLRGVLGEQLPKLPPKMPYRSQSITNYRKLALHNYLQRLLPLVDNRPTARQLLVAFLSHSHEHWKYEPVRPRPPPRGCLYDRSSGATAVSVVSHRNTRRSGAANSSAGSRFLSARDIRREFAPLEPRSMRAAGSVVDDQRAAGARMCAGPKSTESTTPSMPRTTHINEPTAANGEPIFYFKITHPPQA